MAGLVGAGVAWCAGGAAGMVTADLVPGGDAVGTAGVAVAVVIGLVGSALQVVTWRGLCRSTLHAVALTVATLAGAVMLLALTVFPLAELVVRLWPPPPSEKFAELSAAFGIAVFGSGAFVIVAGLPWLALLAHQWVRNRRIVAVGSAP